MLQARRIVLFFVLGAAACAHTEEPTGTTIIVPSEAVSARAYDPDGSVPPRRYVVRMSDGRRDWEVEFPEVATGYELVIPLDGVEGGALVDETHQLTEADAELLAALRRENPRMERQGVYVGGQSWMDRQAGRPAAPAEDGSAADPAWAGGDDDFYGPAPTGAPSAPAAETPAGEAADETPGTLDAPDARLAERAEAAPAPTRPSYLLGVDEVQRLYRGGKYEVAMVKVVDLSRAYPGDPKLLAMKGSLWLKLGRADLAAEAWEEALRIDPSDRSLVRALERLRRLEQRPASEN